jgi:UDP-N-acetylmuramate--alanine ligase
MIRENTHSVYFLGIGGIGMSALARYFAQKGMHVGGYDRTSTELSKELEEEGMEIHYEDNPDLIPEKYRDPLTSLIIYTAAIPSKQKELNYFKRENFRVIKRSVALGEIVKSGQCIAVAGTHGKTTISGMLAHILHGSELGCNAFLGGISVNYNTNYLINSGSNIYVAEADEFDRSFLTLFPDIAIITAIDADHLDIYDNAGNLNDSFSQFASQLKNDGVLIVKEGVILEEPAHIRIRRYSLETKCDYYAYNIERTELNYRFSIHTPNGDFHNIKTGIPGRINIENSVAAFALGMEAGVKIESLISGIESYKGIRRRFEIIVHNDKHVYIDDYAHHPVELDAIIGSVRAIFPDKRISGIFQPHLFTRTRDHYVGFAESLSQLDDVVLLGIYPAREEPIPGINSEIIFKKLNNNGYRSLCDMSKLMDEVEKINPEVLITMGAGDIDKMVNPIKQKLLEY